MAHVTVVGAGLAGLAAAVDIADAGHEVVVLEASNGIGGRLQTDSVDGYLLDRGFQMLLTGYPTAQAMFDYDALDLRHFAPGALVQLRSGRVPVGDPFARPADAADAFAAPVGSLVDKARLAWWRRSLLEGSVDQLWRRGEVTTRSRLLDRSFSAPFIDSFLGPFLATQLLDAKLDVTSRLGEFVLRMLIEGDVAVPALGMGELANQLALRLPDDSIRLHSRVVHVGAHHVDVDGSDRQETDAVIVATDMDTAAELVDTPRLGWNSATTWWFSASSEPFAGPLLLLNGTTIGPISSVAVLSSVSPHYAPVGRALIAVTALGDTSGLGDPEATSQLTRWFGKPVESWDLVRRDVIDHASPRHLPGEALPAEAELESGVFVAGDHRHNPSIDGALKSGRRAAKAVSRSLQANALSRNS